MPRHNASGKVRNGQRTHDQEQYEDIRTVTCEQMARDLVVRGLASEYILSPRRGRTEATR